MIPTQNRIKNQSNNYLQELYAIISQPATTAFIPTETMEGDEEETSLQQACQTVHAKRGLAEDKEAEGQAWAPCAFEVVDGQERSDTA